jgi:cytoskeleton-associated protein 5
LLIIRIIFFKVVGGASKPSGRKKDEDVDTSPLLQNNNLKNQRSIDEQKLKVSL